MIKSFTKSLALAAALSLPLMAQPWSTTEVEAAEKTDFKVCWTIYAGWMPWGYIQESGIMKKWADKYDINVEVVQLNDYIEAINQYTAGQFDGCTMTNMDAVSIPAAGGVDSTALIPGDYSDGNDGIILKDGTELADIKGDTVNLVELSVSHYFLARALDSVGLTERDIEVVNTSDADMVAAYGTDQVTSVVTWNPMLLEILDTQDGTLVYDSSKIPGEIIDIMVVNTETLKDNPDFGKALVGAWFETMALMQSGTPEGEEALTKMASAAGTDLEGYKKQIAATYMFWTPDSMLEFLNSGQVMETTEFVSEFLFSHGILGEGATSAEFVGVEMPDGEVWGEKGNVKFRYSDTLIESAAKGEL